MATRAIVQRQMMVNPVITANSAAPGAEEMLASDVLAELDPILIDGHPDQPRTEKDLEWIAELAENIKEIGQQSPIVVTRSKIPGRFDLTVGSCRLAAIMELRDRKVKAIIRDIEEQNRHLYAVFENIKRKDMTLRDTGLSVRKVMEDYNLNQAQVAEKLGKSAAWVSRYLSVLDAPAEVQEALERKEISIQSAAALADMKPGKRLNNALAKAKAGEKSSGKADNSEKKLLVAIQLVNKALQSGSATIQDGKVQLL